MAPRPASPQVQPRPPRRPREPRVRTYVVEVAETRPDEAAADAILAWLARLRRR